MIPDLWAQMADHMPALQTLWSAEYNVWLERTWWISVMAVQHELGVGQITAAGIADYRSVAANIDLESIKRREMVTKHDVKARLEEFCALAGHQYAHLGLTSSDVVDNIALIKMRRAAGMLRTHYGPERCASIDRVAVSLPLKGVHGPVGTDQDILGVVGSPEAVDSLNDALARHWEMNGYLNSPSQVYHRSIDLQVVSACVQDAGRVQPYHGLLMGLQTMCADYAGDVWNEGDVSHSAIRRYCLPNAFFALAAALERQRRFPGPAPWVDGSVDVDLSACPYFRGEGSCSFGCSTEPSCMTDRPRGGWPGERFLAPRSQ